MACAEPGQRQRRVRAAKRRSAGARAGRAAWAREGARGRAGESRAEGGSRVGRRLGAEREEEGGREKEKGNGEKKMRKREKEKEKRGGEKEKKGRRIGADRGNRSRVADRRSSGAG